MSSPAETRLTVYRRFKVQLTHRAFPLGNSQGVIRKRRQFDL